ncbi:cytochrome c biogenesis heme-transporting ATPase CcmA [Psychromonas sp. 14N.309.X.WAT.B.A12]|uniref:cytochrome c biogenesis heme-transporting ATPase CcmA n=1 Tax=unclassified Psychromonas TaxID=2614957 RepID=UPI0025B1035A|nr:cytochrome c biogenesis heme-transporting ATPase CcmA [Psychromonas sp. 14N.309.X.WAT.B.A12]MDN2662862.1 cytochrome c biogenesis heme-transporting ATPase CcmA [Psychromonas sp. 14N.309.X.WAT.B.A12]
MLECRNLTCVREQRVLFKQLNFMLSAGEILHLEGPNGAGKTSLLRLLTGLSSAYSGDIYWQQENIIKQRESYYKALLYLGHKSGIKPELTVLENLQSFQRLYSTQADADLFEALLMVGLVGYEYVPAAQLSAGQQRRIALARMYITDCKLWILDEPFTSLDKHAVQVLEKRLIKHAEQGGAIVLTTHHELSIPESAYKKLRLSAPAEEEQYV